MGHRWRAVLGDEETMLAQVLLRPALAQAEESSRVNGPARYARHHIRPSR